MAEVKSRVEDITQLETLQKEYAKIGKKVEFTPSEPLSFGELDLSGIDEADRMFVEKHLGRLSTTLNYPSCLITLRM
jgi:hypothetical protein